MASSRKLKTKPAPDPDPGLRRKKSLGSMPSPAFARAGPEPINHLAVALGAGVVRRVRRDVEPVAERQPPGGVEVDASDSRAVLTRAQRVYGFRHAVEHAQKGAGRTFRQELSLFPTAHCRDR